MIFHKMYSSPQQSHIRSIEQSAAAQISHFMQSEFGLQAASSRAHWTSDALTVTLMEALTPVGQAAAQSVDGDSLLETAYDTLYYLNQSRVHALISQVVGQNVQRSSIEIDAKTSKFKLTFYFREMGG